MNQFPSKNYFTLPNEIFSLGLGAGEIAVYAYLRCLENPSTYQCWPSYATIGKAIGRTKNTVMQYVDALSEKGLISFVFFFFFFDKIQDQKERQSVLCHTADP